MSTSIKKEYEPIIAAIQATGGRVTEVRKRIINTLGGSPKPLSIQEVARLCRLDEVSVYRTVAFLKELGFAEEILTPDGTKRFALALHHHDHIMCTSCGFLAHIPCSEKEAKRTVRHASFASVGTHSLTYHGICTKCAD